MYVPASQFPNGKSDDGKTQLYHDAPAVPDLTPAQVREIKAALEAMPNMAGYIQSGCHDRAHAVWLMLAPHLKARVAKIWVFAPQALTLSFPDGITFARKDGNRATWGYHVALFYRADGEARVIDPTRDDWKAEHPTREGWLAAFTTPPLSIYTTLDPSLYLFYALTSANGPTNNGVTAVVNNGQFFEYIGPAAEYAYIPNALARDEVGLRLGAESMCAPLGDVAKTKPGTLLSVLQNPSPQSGGGKDVEALNEVKRAANADASCHAYFETFKQRLAFWRSAIKM